MSLVVDAAYRVHAAWVRERVASIDPMFNDYCGVMTTHHRGPANMNSGHRTQDRTPHVCNGLAEETTRTAEG